MKLLSSKVSTFKPVELTITVETQEEFDALFAIGNWNSPLRQVIRDHSKVNDSIVNEILHGIFNELKSHGNPSVQ